MPDTPSHIDRIREKAQELIRRYHALQKEVDRLSKENEQLRAREAAQKEEVGRLHLRLDVLKMNVGSLSDEDRKTLEKQLNHYIREVDRCITLLTE